MDNITPETETAEIETAETETAETETAEIETAETHPTSQETEDLKKISQLALRIFCCWGAMNRSEYRAFMSVFMSRDPCLETIQRVLEAVEVPSILLLCDALVGNVEARIK